MKISISNIAWDVDKDEKIVELLHEKEISHIDIAPTKYFAAPFLDTKKTVQSVRDWWNERGIEIYGMQALLFGQVGLNMFSGPEIQREMTGYLRKIFSIAEGLGVRRLVFGSPKNRDIGNMDHHAALATGVEYFRQLGDVAAAYGIVICLEPNPRAYNCNFMTNMASTYEVIDMVNHPAIKGQLDLGSLIMNGESLSESLELYSDSIYHIHVSEPFLKKISDNRADHTSNSMLLKKYLPELVVTIEMAAAEPELQYSNCESSISIVKKYYG